MTVLLAAAALGVDYAVLVADRNHAQRAVDAAALAGASQLKSQGDALDMENARRIAVATAATNGITVPPGDISFNSDATQISVPSRINRSLYFARFVGINSAVVTAKATAEIVPGDDFTDLHIVPIGITWNTYLTYTRPLNTNPQVLSLVRQLDTVYDVNKFVVFDLRANSAKSPDAMVDQLVNLQKISVHIGDYETTLNAEDGAVGQKFETAMTQVFTKSAQAPWNDTWTGNLFTSTGIRYNEILAGTAGRNNPRVMYLVVNPDNLVANNGTFNTQIQGYAPVYVEGYQKVPGSDGKEITQLTVRFLPATTTSEGNGSAPGSAFSGARSVHLIE